MGGRYKLNVDILSKHSDVTGSCTLVTVHLPEGKIKFLVDMGLYQGDEVSDAKNYAPLDFKPEELQFVLVTHNHIDHVGRIPLLYRKGYKGQTHTTIDTAQMLKLSLEDTVKIFGINAAEYNKKPLYSAEDVVETLKNVSTHEFEESFEPYPGIKVTYFMNGHLIGAAITLVQISYEGYDDINLLFTGDYNKSNTFFKVKSLPDWVKELPITIVTESTYGNIDSKDSNKPVFVDNIVNAIKTKKKLIFIPVFSLGRAQEILYKLKCMQDSKIISTDIPIYLDGQLAKRYTELYRYRLNIDDSMKNFLPQNFSYMNQQLKDECLRTRNTKIILSTSGMGNFGPAKEYISKLIEMADVHIHFVGYTAPTTLGYRLINTDINEPVEIGSVVKIKKATVTTTGEFSTHAKRDELIAFLNEFKNLRLVLINHGEISVKEKFSDTCMKKTKAKAKVGILGIGITYRIDRWGLVKTMTKSQ